MFERLKFKIKKIFNYLNNTTFKTLIDDRLLIIYSYINLKIKKYIIISFYNEIMKIFRLI